MDGQELPRRIRTWDGSSAGSQEWNLLSLKSRICQKNARRSNEMGKKSNWGRNVKVNWILRHDRKEDLDRFSDDAEHGYFINNATSQFQYTIMATGDNSCLDGEFVTDSEACSRRDNGLGRQLYFSSNRIQKKRRLGSEAHDNVSKLTKTRNVVLCQAWKYVISEVIEIFHWLQVSLLGVRERGKRSLLAQEGDFRAPLPNHPPDQVDSCTIYLIVYVQGSARLPFPGFENAAGKLRQMW